jgi:hypothetical protein
MDPSTSQALILTKHKKEKHNHRDGKNQVFAKSTKGKDRLKERERKLGSGSVAVNAFFLGSFKKNRCSKPSKVGILEKAATDSVTPLPLPAFHATSVEDLVVSPFVHVHPSLGLLRCESLLLDH